MDGYELLAVRRRSKGGDGVVIVRRAGCEDRWWPHRKRRGALRFVGRKDEGAREGSRRTLRDVVDRLLRPRRRPDRSGRSSERYCARLLRSSCLHGRRSRSIVRLAGLVAHILCGTKGDASVRVWGRYPCIERGGESEDPLPSSPIRVHLGRVGRTTLAVVVIGNAGDAVRVTCMT